MRLTAAITEDGDWFVAQCLEVDVASQGRSIEEARGNFAEALALHFGAQDVEVGEAPIIAPIDVAVRVRTYSAREVLGVAASGLRAGVAAGQPHQAAESCRAYGHRAEPHRDRAGHDKVDLAAG
jgi:predicted RNase H-like HicB family nuclease